MRRLLVILVETIGSFNLRCITNESTVLETLEKEHHEERDGNGTGVDDKLPVFGVVEKVTHRGPY